MIEMAVTETEWLWDVTMTEKIVKGKPVFTKYKKVIYRSWVHNDWVRGKGSIEQLSLFN